MTDSNHEGHSGSFNSRKQTTTPELLVIAKGFPPTTGGVEQYSQQVVEAYLRRGFNVRVLTQTEGPAGWSTRESAAGAFELWNAGRGSQPTTFLRMLREAARLRRHVAIGLVHATTWRVSLVALALFRGADLAITVHGREVLNFPSYLGPAMRLSLRRADLVLAVSMASLEAAREASSNGQPGRASWQVRYNGLTWLQQASEIAGRTPGSEPLTILSLSRLVPRKNLSGALRAVARLREMTPVQFRYLIAGTGPDREILEQEVERLGLEEVVQFLGYVDDGEVTRLYRDADIFLHPHTHTGEGRDFEGFGIVIADAMSFGCAVVVGDVGGPKELVQDGETGLLINGANVENVAAALNQLAEDQELRARLGSAARRYALDKFSWDAHVEPVLTLIRQRNEPIAFRPNASGKDR